MMLSEELSKNLTPAEATMLSALLDKLRGDEGVL
jgi:hypothetical protein